MQAGRSTRTQSLNEWVAMLHDLFGSTQNYAKTTFEVHAHLTEVCGVFAKHLFKKKDIATAKTFLPKIFAWAVALLKRVRPDEEDLEGILLRKFPGVCPYCVGKPCTCSRGEKPDIAPDELRRRYYRIANSKRRGLNDIQLMFRSIYETTWIEVAGVGSSAIEDVRVIHTRLIEELAEVGEALRFNHLYPGNFENELADLFAWWFAIVSSMHRLSDSSEVLLAEDVLWEAYPGQCTYCQRLPCFCRPGPVRELMSRPPPGHEDRIDGLTMTWNQKSYEQDLQAIANRAMPAPCPLACVRIDVDDFKDVNNSYGHPAGDVALKAIATAARKKVREHDRVYRVGGDEFAVIMPDWSAEEASGAMRRLLAELKRVPVRYVSQAGAVTSFHVSLSIGVAECDTPEAISRAFELADQAAYKSKADGKGRVTRHTPATEDRGQEGPMRRRWLKAKRTKRDWAGSAALRGR